MKKDENDRKREGTLPHDPEDDVEPMPRPVSPSPLHTGVTGAPPPPQSQPLALTTLGSYLMRALETAGRRMRGDEKPIPLPWEDLKVQLGGGLWPGLHVLVSGTGVGKTQWVLQVAVGAAQQDFPVAYVGLELSAEAVAMRAMGQRAGFHWSKLFTGKATDLDLQGAVAAANELKPLPIYVEQRDPMGWAASRLLPLAEAMRKAHPDDKVPLLIILDFLQLVGTEQEAPRMDLRERIGQAAYRGQAVAQRYNAAVLMISSTARTSYAKVGGEIKEAGLGIDDEGVRFIRNPDALIGLGKESGEIEYACDSVTAGIRLRGEDSRARTTVFATAKVRAGIPGWSALTFDGNTFAPMVKYDGIKRLIEEEGDEQKATSVQRKQVGGPSEPERKPIRVR